MGESAFEQRATGKDAFEPLSESANSAMQKFLQAIEAEGAEARPERQDDSKLQPEIHETPEAKKETSQKLEVPDAKQETNESSGTQIETNEIPESKQEIQEVFEVKEEIPEAPTVQPELIEAQEVKPESLELPDVKPETLKTSNLDENGPRAENETAPVQKVGQKNDFESLLKENNIGAVGTTSEFPVKIQNSPQSTESTLPGVDLDALELRPFPNKDWKPTFDAEKAPTKGVLDPSTDPNFRLLSPREVKDLVSSKKVTEGEPVSLSLDEIENQVVDRGFGTIGLISPSLSFKTSASDEDITRLADSITKAAVENKDAERALQEEIKSSNDLGSFGAAAGSIASTLGIGWAVNKLASNLPGVARFPAVIATAFTGGGMVNNELSGKELFDSSGFIKNAIDSTVAWGIYKSLGALPANQAVSAETLAKAGMDPSKNILASQLGNELRMHHHNLEVAAWKAMDKSKAMEGLYYKQLFSTLFNPLGALTAKAEMNYVQKGPQLSFEADKLFTSRFKPSNYTPFRETLNGRKRVGMGGDKTSDALIAGLTKRGEPIYGGMSIGEYNTRLMAARLYGATAGAFVFGAAHKTGDIITSEEANDKSLTENLKDIGKAGFGAAYTAPLVAIALRHGHGAAFGTGIVITAKGANSLEHHYQEKRYEDLKKLGQEREESRQRYKNFNEEFYKAPQSQQAK